MTCIEKILLAFVIVHVALVLAKPHKFKFDEPEEDASGSGSRDSNEMMDYFRKRATDCGSGVEAEGAYSKKCRSSCKLGEMDVTGTACGGQKCCMCHARYGTCTVE